MCFPVAYIMLTVVVVILLLLHIPFFKYYAKFAIFFGLLTFGSFYYMLEFLIRGRDYKNSWRFKRLFRISGQLIGLKPVTKGREYLTMDKPCIYVANHQSSIDVISLVDVWPERCTIISKASMKYAGPVGLITWFCKMIYIDRSNHKDALSVINCAAEEASLNKVSVYVFPEGTRSMGETLLPFKKGAFHLAIRCQYPIQPIVISPYGRFLNSENKKFESASYYVEVLPQISTEGMDISNVDSLLSATRERMLECFETLKSTEPPN